MEQEKQLSIVWKSLSWIGQGSKYVRTKNWKENHLFQVHSLKGEYVAADGEAFEKELNRFLHYVSIIWRTFPALIGVFSDELRVESNLAFWKSIISEFLLLRMWYSVAHHSRSSSERPEICHCQK